MRVRIVPPALATFCGLRLPVNPRSVRPNRGGLYHRKESEYYEQTCFYTLRIEPIGINGTMEANGRVYHFCCGAHREQYREIVSKLSVCRKACLENTWMELFAINAV